MAVDALPTQAWHVCHRLSVRAKLVPGYPVKTVLGENISYWVQRTGPYLFPRPHDLQNSSALLTLLLPQQINSFPCRATLKSVRMVLGHGMSQQSLPCSLTLKGPQGSGLVGAVPVAQGDLLLQR